VFDLIFVRRTEADGGDDRQAIEEIGTAGIRNQGIGNSGVFSFRLGAEEGIQVLCFETNLGAGKTFEVFSEECRIRFLTTKKSSEIGVTSLGGDFARGHPQVGTDYGVEPKNRVKYLRHAWDDTHIRTIVNPWCFRWELNPQQRF
jgi:hypothetical protein